ncbi:hypothetical protein AXF12_06100 [Capnocytophaga haemolytica]|uniref:Uncharacterized protein n=1 Tax=Capnocytophaga haemolytica TaxID=45243 RepID=A0ABM5XCV6_9FLAO|nr:hypothetical protein [Capnocytophaga haemolytica]AMD85127.1 hypothetical protein AXF12_06100 [Capnocytophaga haemolytica]
MRQNLSNILVWSIVLGSAAFSVVFGIREHNQRKSAQLAYRQVKKSLLMLSEQYNKGVEKLSYLKVYEQTERRIVKTNE